MGEEHVWVFSGLVHPERAAVNVSPLSLRFDHDASRTADAELSVALSHVSVRVTGDPGTWTCLP